MDIPIPKTISVMKAAIKLPEFDDIRKGKTVFDLDEPADAIDLSSIATADLCFLLDGYRRRRKPTGPRVRHRQFKVNEFVDSSRAIIGSSQEQSADSNKSRKVVNS